MFCVVNKKDLLFPDPMMTTSSQESRGQRGLLALVCEGDPVLGQQQQDELSWLAHGTESIWVCHPIHWRSACSLDVSVTSQQYFSLRTNQPRVLFSQHKSAPATSQMNRLLVFLLRLVHGAAMAWKPSMMRVTNRKSRRH
jgi:hypothetical protein